MFYIAYDIEIYLPGYHCTLKYIFFLNVTAEKVKIFILFCNKNHKICFEFVKIIALTTARKSGLRMISV